MTGARIAIALVLLAGCSEDKCRMTTCGLLCGGAIAHCLHDAQSVDSATAGL